MVPTGLMILEGEQLLIHPTEHLGPGDLNNGFSKLACSSLELSIHSTSQLILEHGKLSGYHLINTM